MPAGDIALFVYTLTASWPNATWDNNGATLEVKERYAVKEILGRLKRHEFTG